MKNTISALGIFFVVATLLSSCTPNSSETTDSTSLENRYIKLSNELLTKHNGTEYSGKTTITNTSADEMVLDLRTGEDRVVFLVQTEKQPISSQEIKSDAQVFHFGSFLLLNIVEPNKLYAIDVNNEEAKQVSSDVREEITGIDNSLSAFGLARYNFSVEESKKLEIIEGQPFLESLAVVYPDEQIADECSSGGEGAVSCSESWESGTQGGGCSVTCGSGYYACCNSASGGGCVCKTIDKQ